MLEEYKLLPKAYCHECTQWANPWNANASKQCPKKLWRFSWPALTAYLLGTNHAQQVWQCLPPQLRWSWRGLRVGCEGTPLCVHDVVGDVFHPSVSKFFPDNASLEAYRDTKCAECAFPLCPEEVHWTPMFAFEKCQFWHPKEVCRAIKHCMAWDDNAKSYCTSPPHGQGAYCLEHTLERQPHMCNAPTTAGGFCRNVAGACPLHQRESTSDSDDDYVAMSSISGASRRNARTIAHGGASSQQSLGTASRMAGSTFVEVADNAVGTESWDRQLDVAHVPEGRTRCRAVTGRGEGCRRYATANGLCGLHQQWQPHRPQWDMQSHGLSGHGHSDEWLDNLHSSVSSSMSSVSYHGTWDTWDGKVDAMVGYGPADEWLDTMCDDMASCDSNSGESNATEDEAQQSTVSESSTIAGDEVSEYEEDGAEVADFEQESDNESDEDTDGESQAEGEQPRAEEGSGADTVQPRQRRKKMIPKLHVAWNIFWKHPYLDHPLVTRVAASPDYGLCWAVCAECKAQPRRHFCGVVWPNDSWYATTDTGHTVFSPPEHCDLYWLSPVRICESALSGTVVRTNAEGQWRNPRYQMLALTGDGRGLSTQYVSLDLNPGRRLHLRLGSPLLRPKYIQTILHWRRDLLPFFTQLYGSRRAVVENNTKAELRGFVCNDEEADWVNEIPMPKATEEEDTNRKYVQLEAGPPGWICPRALPRTGSQHAVATALQVVMQLRFARHMLLACKGMPSSAIFDDMRCIVHQLMVGAKPQILHHKELLYTLRDDSQHGDGVALNWQEARCAVTVVRTMMHVLHVESCGSAKSGMSTYSSPRRYHHSKFMGPALLDARRMTHSDCRFDMPCVYHYRAAPHHGAPRLDHLHRELERLPVRHGWVRGPVLMVWFDGTQVDEPLQCCKYERILGRYVLRAIVDRTVERDRSGRDKPTWEAVVTGRTLNGNSAWAVCTSKRVQWLPPDADWVGRNRHWYLLVFENEHMIPGRDYEDIRPTPVAGLQQSAAPHTNDGNVDMDVDAPNEEESGMDTPAFDPFSHTDMEEDMVVEDVINLQQTGGETVLEMGGVSVDDAILGEHYGGNAMLDATSTAAAYEQELLYGLHAQAHGHGGLADDDTQTGAEAEVPPAVSVDDYDEEQLDTHEARAAFEARLPDNDEEEDSMTDRRAAFVGGGDPYDPGFMNGIYLADAAEYLTGSASHTGAMHVLLSTLAELNTRRNAPARWVRSLVASVVSRTPEVQRVGEYMEAYMYAEHFPVHDAERNHFPGCYPLRMYSNRTMVGGSRGFVQFERYVRDVLNDPHGSRGYDSSWISFAFNVMLMRLLERGPPIAVVKRGLQAALQDYNSQKEYADRFGDTILPGLMYDRDEAQRNVDMLCAAIRKYGPITYFGTFTCDCRNFPGVKEVYDRLRGKRLHPRLFAVAMQRAWYRASQLFMKHMREDPAKPLGNIRHMFAHAEWQTDSPNFNHWHIGIWTDDLDGCLDEAAVQAALKRAQERLCASIQGAFSYLGDPSQEAQWEERAKAVQQHRCSERCMRVNEQGEKRCRFGAPFRTHKDYQFRPLHVDIPDGLRELLLEEGLAEWDDTHTRVLLHPDLRGGIHESQRITGNQRVSQFSPKLFVDSGGCHQNWQVVYGTLFLLAYLVKYLSSEEERAAVRLTKRGPTTLHHCVQDEYARKRRVHLRLKRKMHGRVIGLPEMTFYALGYSSVFCTFDACRVNTTAPENRFTVLRPAWKPDGFASPVFGVPRDVAAGENPGDTTRCGVGSNLDLSPEYPDREPTELQLCTHTSWCLSRTTPDAITVYCLRAPEFLNFTLQQWVEWTISSKKNNHPDTAREKILNWRKYGFFDLRGKSYKLHWEVFLRSDVWRTVFARLGNPHAGEELHEAVCNPDAPRADWMHNVVDFDAPARVMVEPRVLPGPSANFFHQTIVRQAGPFTNEVHLQNQWMTQNAGHVPVTDHGTGLKQMLANLSLRDWVLQELRYWPIGVRTMFRRIETVWELKNNDNTYSIRVPVDEQDMEEKQRTKYIEYMVDVERRHAQVLAGVGPFERAADQTEASWDEQSRAIGVGQRTIREVLNLQGVLPPWERATDALRYVRPIYFEGPPGAGKTHVILQLCRYLQEQGVHDSDWEITSVSALRSAMLGGMHIHDLFGFRPGRSNFWTTPQQLAATAATHLSKRPWKKRRLQEMQFLFIDEFSQVGDALLQAINTTLQKVRGNDLPFGGVCVMACGDHYQTEPIGMRPPYLAGITRCFFRVVSLTQLFRARNDPFLMEVIALMRRPTLTEGQVNRVVDLVTAHCPQHVLASVGSQPQPPISAEAVWLLGKKVAVNKARVEAYNAATAQKHQFQAFDEQCSAGNWTGVKSQRIGNLLDSTTGLVRDFCVVAGMRVTVTQNFFYNGRRVPNGLGGRVETIDVDGGVVKVRFDDQRVVAVHREVSPNVETGGRQVRRRQFPLELAVASTIHDVQGQTLPMVATYMDDDPEHLMWTRSMLFTLFTRVRHLSDIHLVNYDPGVLKELLRHATSWHREVSTWISNGNMIGNPQDASEPISMPEEHAFTVPDLMVLRPRATNVAYLLANASNTAYYIGSTNWMLRRLRQHNAGRVARTCTHRDWRFVFVVTGFDFGRPGERQALSFETQCKNRRANRRDRTELYTFFVAIIDEWRRKKLGNLELSTYP